LAAAGCIEQRPFPDQPVTLICPWSAGGGTDRVSRQVAAQLERELGVPVNVVNAVGGSGVTGHTRGALARPDGYTVTMLTVELNMLHWRGLTELTHRDFAPLAMLNCDGAALFVRGDSPYGALGDLENAVRAEPGKLKVSGTAHGGVWHVAWAGWLNLRGLDAAATSWISINGAGQSLQELAAGGVDVVCCSLPEADALLAGGKIRCLGVMTDRRVPEFPHVPTFREQGHAWSLVGWRGLGAPRETPPERLAVLAAALDRVARSEEMTAFMRNAGFNLTLEGPEQFAATLSSQDELFRGLLQSEGFRSVSAEHFGPMIFPSLVGGLLLLTLVVVVCEVRRERSRPAAACAPASANTATSSAGVSDAVTTGITTNPGGALDRRSLRRVAAVPAAVVFYLAAEEPLGFVLTSAALVGGLLLVFRVRLPTALLTAACMSVAVYQVFAVWLRVPLPRGLFGW
jgi:tripartite-type tricarboxylate transporter receptor subunit TctC